MALLYCGQQWVSIFFLLYLNHLSSLINHFALCEDSSGVFSCFFWRLRAFGGRSVGFYSEFIKECVPCPPCAPHIPFVSCVPYLPCVPCVLSRRRSTLDNKMPSLHKARGTGFHLSKEMFKCNQGV